jgi:hypothetical protein
MTKTNQLRNNRYRQSQTHVPFMKLSIRFGYQLIAEFADATFNPVDRSDLNESKMMKDDLFILPEDPRQFKVVGRFWKFSDKHPAEDELMIFVVPGEPNDFSRYLVKRE